jgi:hypothetical protein
MLGLQLIQYFGTHRSTYETIGIDKIDTTFKTVKFVVLL